MWPPAHDALASCSVEPKHTTTIYESNPGRKHEGVAVILNSNQEFDFSLHFDVNMIR